MKKIQKFYGGGGIALGLDLAPYSYAAPAASTTASTTASTAAGSTVLPTLATIGQAAWPLAAVAAGVGGGLYLLGHAQNGAVSGAIEAAWEKERRRHLAEAEAKWQEKNQYYADLINTYGSIQYPAGTFYDYDPTTGTASLEKDLGNGHVGRWTQNMRTHIQGNPYVYDTATGEIYATEMTGPHSASYVPFSNYSTPMTLSTGQTVALPTDITDYRVFDEAAGTPNTVVVDDDEGTPAPKQEPAPSQNGNNGNNGNGNRNGKGNKKWDNRRHRKKEPDFWTNFKQGRRDVVGNPRHGYRLGKTVGWMEQHPIWTLGGGYGVYKGGEFLYDLFTGGDDKKDPAKATEDINDNALTNSPTNGNTGTATYTLDQIPTDSTSMQTIVWPY